MALHASLRVRHARFARAALLAAAIVIWLIVPGALARVDAAPAGQNGGPGEALFQTKCVACHTIGGGKLVGPDLQGVTARQDAAWLKSFIADPNKLFDAKDPTALQLLAEYNNVKMPALGLTPAEVDELVAFLGQSGAPTAAPAGAAAAAPAPAPAPAAQAAGDPAAGRSFFTGQKAFANGGFACIGCHSMAGLGFLGGGTLGPDLTHAATRYPGPGLAGVLTNIAFPTMAGPFANRPLTPQEVADLVAYLVQADQGQTAALSAAAGAPAQYTVRTLVAGLVGALALIVLMAIFWPRQRQSVSARLRGARRPTAD